jgi:hypothetical protein
VTDFRRLLEALTAGQVESPENMARLAAVLAPLRPTLRGAPAGLPFQVDELELSKRAAGRAKDLADLEAIREIKKRTSRDS